MHGIAVAARTVGCFGVFLSFVVSALLFVTRNKRLAEALQWSAVFWLFITVAGMALEALTR
jgi:hypothetical protein